MFEVKLPAEALYLQSRYTRHSGKLYRMEGKVAKVPMIAVTRKLKKFLDKRGIAYIDPRKTPKKFIRKVEMPFSKRTLGRVLLIPNLSGDNKNDFRFQAH